MRKGIAGILILLIILAVAGVGAGAYYFGAKNGKIDIPSKDEIISGTGTPTLPATSTPSPTPTPESDVPSGWSTFISQQYGFKIYYPSTYKALTDSENLYGWPHAVVLFYKGGQSYDLPIEHWNSQAEYEAVYKNFTNVTVKKVGNYYITLFNANYSPEVDSIIATFKPL